MEEQRILKKIIRGNEHALEAAIAQYTSYVLAVIHNRSRGYLSQEDEEEAASDVFYALWQHAGEISPGCLRSWLGSVARNKTVDRLRRRKIELPLEETTAVLDDPQVEPLTDYGKANLTSSNYDLLLSDVTHLSGGTVGSQIIESSEELVRILVWSVKADSIVQSGDLISFEVTVLEDGDTASHRYSLFNAPIDSVLTDSVSLTGDGDYVTVVLTPLTLHLKKVIDLGISADASATERIEKEHKMGVMDSPEITLTMTDGSRYPVLDGNWHAGDADLGQYGTLDLSTEGEDQDDGSVIISHTLLFTQPVDLSSVASVIIDGIVYTVK